MLLLYVKQATRLIVLVALAVDGGVWWCDFFVQYFEEDGRRLSLCRCAGVLVVANACAVYCLFLNGSSRNHRILFLGARVRPHVSASDA